MKQHEQTGTRVSLVYKDNGLDDGALSPQQLDHFLAKQAYLLSALENSHELGPIVLDILLSKMDEVAIATREFLVDIATGKSYPEGNLVTNRLRELENEENGPWANFINGPDMPDLPE